ncbi:unnamed protein product [Effrenium voratum]|uniref:Uncharacterized protein n=1 Tax=Effrenium voratum TaxID=2562239 RepID=A0AA36HTW1_9DINO|nr:unnamed protein product [Effrenium voratum]
MLCSRCGVFKVSSRRGVGQGLCCNRCPDHGPWCSSREAKAPKPANAKRKEQAKAENESAAKKHRAETAKAASASLPLPLPQLRCLSLRNLSRELREAKEDPKLKEARKAQEEAVAKDYEAKRKWEEATMDVAAKEAALLRSEAELAKARELAEAGNEEAESAASTARAVQQAERKVLQDRCAADKARELQILDKQRKAIQEDREKQEAHLKDALAKVKVLNSAHAVTASDLGPPFLAVTPTTSGLEVDLGALQELLRAEWCVSVDEVCVPVRLLQSELSPADLLQLELPKGHTAHARLTEECIAQLKDLPKGKCRAQGVSLLRGWLGLEPMRLHKEVTAQLERLLSRREPDKNLQPPAALQGTLRSYQAHGFSWMASNVRNGVGCLLADDMGLGKTLQTIALLLHLKAARSQPFPALVVMPLSILGNWSSELATWAPSLRCVTYHGSNRALPKNCLREGPAKGAATAEADVVLTTYHLLRDDLQLLLERCQFSAMVLDESQAIKNRSSQITRAAIELAEQTVGSTRIALTGTPVENTLAELHSIFSFILPGYLGSARDFEKEFTRPLEKVTADGHCTLRARLLHAIRPFVLRRCKSDEAVAPDLPPKIELTHAVMLTSAQRTLYEAVKKHELEKVLEAKVAEGQEERLELGLEESKEAAPITVRAREVLSVLHALQQICNHPRALGGKHWPPGVVQDERFTDAAETSGKMSRLMALLEEVLAPSDGQGEKVLIFTQYVNTALLLQSTIEANYPQIKALAIFGSVGLPEREELLRRFKTEPRCAVMIMTLGTGGVGLNLVEASHVVHYDRCWNPAREAQATDRAHRIGQCRTVMVHRLVTSDTVEERLAAELTRKSRLAGEVVPTSATDISSFSVQELVELLSGQA